MVSQVVKSPAMLIIAFAVFILLIFFVFELFFRMRIGRIICNFAGGLFIDVLGYTGVLSGTLTKIGVEVACNAFPI